MDFWVYMLKCSDDSFYVGHTDDLDKRIVEHQFAANPNAYTATRRPVTLVFCTAFPTRDEAVQREMQLKNWSRRKKEALVTGDWGRIAVLAHGRGRLGGRRVEVVEAGPRPGSDRPEAGPRPGSDRPGRA